MKILDELGIPDDFKGRPYDYAVNEISKAAVAAALVATIGLVLPIAIAFAVVIIAGIALEALHILRGGSLADSLEDVAFEVAGASVAIFGLWPVWIATAALAAGIVKRSR